MEPQPGAGGASSGGAPNTGSAGMAPSESGGAPSAPGAGGMPAGPAPSSACPAEVGSAPSGESDALLVAGVEPEDYNFHLYEGPVWIGDALYFTDINPSPWNSNIRKVVFGNPLTVSNFMVAAGANGLAVDAAGVMFSATPVKKEISRYDLQTGAQETAVMGSFNSPNDLAIASDGTIYFSDPQQGELPAGNQPQVIHVVKDGVDQVLTADIMSPNGVMLSPAEDALYVAGGGYTGYIKRVALVDGLAGEIEDLVTDLQVPDGMTKDCAGNLYVAVHEQQAVAVFDPTGAPLATIRLGNAANGQAAKPTNVAFGGPDRRTLYITASYSLWQIPLQIAGYPY